MTRVVVHAGLSKTGTSAVQQWLHTHRHLLAEYGVRYPDHPIGPNGVSSGHLRTVLEPNGEGWFNMRTDEIERVLADAEADNVDVLLLSSEHFQNWVADLIPVLPASTRFILYVRDPLSFLESAYNQEVKRGGRRETLNTTPPAAGVGTQGFAAMHQRIPATTDIVLRPYHPDLLIGGSVLADLLHTAEIDLTGLDLPEPAWVNPSFTLPALEFMRTANHYPLEKLAHALDHALQSCTVGAGPYSLLTRKQYRAFRVYARAELDELITTFGQDSLAPMRDLIQAQPQPPRRKQRAKRKELRAVAEYVENQAPAAFKDLTRLVKKNPTVDAPYAGFPTFRR